MNPRKSSTSSGKPSGLRPRYLGIEVAGQHLPPASPRAWESLLSDRLARAGVSVRRLRLIRAEGRRAIVEVDQWTAARARSAWSAETGGTGDVPLRPHRTWGTLVGAKAWLRGQRTANPTR